MKTIVMSFSAALLLMTAAGNAAAVTCAEGVRHAGCVGTEGAVAVRKPPEAVAAPAAVVVPKKEVVVAPQKEVVVAPQKEVVVAEPKPCRIVDGVRVCR